jgi:diguanylate cyclase (GGDEF)-like protein
MSKRYVAKNSRAKVRIPSAQPRVKGAEAAPAVSPSGQRPRSTAMRLAEEVSRLELELAAARTRIAALELRAAVDPLTDLVNRRGLERELKRALAYVKRYGTGAVLIYIDLDQFKLVNDRYGHAAGDAVLKGAAMVLARHVRASDLVARIGGDEFAILLWNLDAADAQAKARSLEAAIGCMTAVHADAQLRVGASVGSTLLLPLDTVASALERADRAMYARKTERRSTGEARNEPSPHSASSG